MTTTNFIHLSSVFAPEHTASHATFPELKTFLKLHSLQKQADKAQLPAISFADYDCLTSHKKSHCLRVTALALDIDEQPLPGTKEKRPVSSEELAALFNWLAPYEYIQYTSFSHTPQSPRLRIIIRLNSPVPASDWPVFFAAVTRLCPIIDTQTKNPNRLFYVPSNGAQVYHHIPSDPEPFKIDLRPIPSVATSPAPQAPQDVQDLPGLAICTKADIRRVVGHLARSKHQNPRRFGAILQNVLDGVPFAQDGGRDDTTFRLCYFIAKELPETDPGSIARYFEQSLQAMGWECDVSAKLERQQELVREELEAANKAADTSQRLNIKRAFAHEDEPRDWPYTQQELTDLADALNITREVLKGSWIIQKGKTYWVLTARGYIPFSIDEVSNAARVHLAPATTDDVSLYMMRNNEICLKTPSQLVRDYGAVATTVMSHIDIRHSSHDDKTGVFHEALCPLRSDLSPLDPYGETFNQIDTWINKLGRSRAMHLKRWLFWSTHLTSPCVALFITGAPGSGKNLLASGVARLWNSVPTPLEGVFGNFNESIATCPLLLADEQIPKDFKGNARTEELREIIQGNARELRRKNKPSSTLQGAIRLIIASNSEEILKFNGEISENDIAAISERILHIEATLEATHYLQSIGQDAVNKWVSQDLIARYVLALQLIHNDDFKPQCRFLIQTEGNLIYRAVANTTNRFEILKWMVAVVMNPTPVRSMPGMGKLLKVSGGNVYVHRQAIEATWNSYCNKFDMPRSNMISKELLRMGARTKMPGHSLNVYKINRKHLQTWIEREGSISWSEFEKLLDTGLEFGEKEHLDSLN